ncbi:MAG: hypothetical protein OQK12_04975 [Motiliproteus sp.]|nr:hypothetical protein [Motiliproteus sp.]MCW9052930.1 hypothetical protein [Motiliproteus sp.]
MDNNRLLLEIDKYIRDINRSVINPVIPELALEDIAPVTKMVAGVRASYLKELFDIAAVTGDEQPTADQVRRLSELRKTYDELVLAAQALEGAIQRGYLDVKGGLEADLEQSDPE